MKQNLDTLIQEIDGFLRKSGLIVFYGMPRGLDKVPEIEWDTKHHPDYKQFIEVAQALGVRLVILHHRQFNAEILERALEELEDSGLEFDDQRHLEGRLKEARMYDGFTCAIEISFDHNGLSYMYELHTEWYDEVSDLLDELDLNNASEDIGGDESFGGYYSKN
ncbi:MAG TPA: hypothetical protein VES20_16830 [Bryobacteraceae bacterium]|nr:hypothetical protein [Bryobacteraceae bacterium]